MAAINFPSSPTGGQQYTFNGITYYYDAGVGAWLTSVVGNPIVIATATTGNTAPSTPVAGDLWFNTDLSKMFVYYNDGDTSQWVEPSYSTVFNRDADLNASFTVANAAFAKANSALANTTNTVFSGNLTITGTSTVGSSVVTGAVIETKVAMAANDVNLLSGSYFTKTIGSATTLTVSNIPATGNAASFILDLTNGGAGTITWWANTKWAGGAAPTLTASGRDVLGFFTHDAGTTWSGLVLGKDVK